jgi:hypothetical protein
VSEDKKTDPPEGYGSWGEVSEDIDEQIDKLREETAKDLGEDFKSPSKKNFDPIF